MATRNAPSRSDVNSASSPVPTTTSYGIVPGTRIRVTASFIGRGFSHLGEIVEQAGDDLGDPARTSPLRVDDQDRQGAIDRLTRRRELRQPVARIVRQERAARSGADPVGQRRELGVQQDHGYTAGSYGLLRRFGEHGPAAQRQDTGELGERVGDYAGFQLPKGWFAVLGEDARNRAPGSDFDHRIGVRELDPQTLRDPPADTALSRAGQADQQDSRRHRQLAGSAVGDSPRSASRFR